MTFSPDFSNSRTHWVRVLSCDAKLDSINKSMQVALQSTCASGSTSSSISNFESGPIASA